MNQVQILVLDFGSQYTQLIARRLREYGVYTEIVPYFEKLDSIRARNPKGIILSGGPASVYEKDAYKPDSRVFELGIPVLGICYGMQYIASFFGGRVVRAEAQEFGKAVLEILSSDSDVPTPLHKQDSSDFLITKAIEADLEEILALQHIAFAPEAERVGRLDIEPLTQDLASIKREFQTHIFIKCVHNGALIGSVRGYVSDDTAHIGKLFVAPKFTGNGLAKAMILELERHLPAKRYEIFTSVKSVENIKRYEKLGYKQYARKFIDDDIEMVFLEKFASSRDKIPQEQSVILRTKRTILREFRQDDFVELKQILSDEKTMYAWGHGFSDDEVQEWLDLQFRRYASDGVGTWAMIEAQSGKLIGTCGLNYTEISTDGAHKRRVVEIGYIVKHSYWGKGYALECAEACRDYAFSKLGLSEVYCLIKDDNFASMKVARKLEMRLVGENIKNYKGEDLRHYLFNMKNSELIFEAEKGDAIRNAGFYANMQESLAQNSDLSLDSKDTPSLFRGVKQDSIVWMSHADKVEKIPQGFIELAKSGNTHYCAIADLKRDIYALQFHPEVVHSECGGQILKNFAVDICRSSTDWNMQNFVQSEIAKLRKIVGVESHHTESTSERHSKDNNYARFTRCAWAKAKNPDDERLYQSYHDNEWGVPLHDDTKLFELLVLEGMQAGLSWLTILKKREAFRVAFDGFNPAIVAKYDEAKIESLMANEGIIRNRKKIESAIANAGAFLRIQREFGSFARYIWGFVEDKPIINHPKSIADLPTRTALSDRISKDLQKRGFKFVGSTIMYAFMQSMGIVNDHVQSCVCSGKVRDSIDEVSDKSAVMKLQDSTNIDRREIFDEKLGLRSYERGDKTMASIDEANDKFTMTKPQDSANTDRQSILELKSPQRKGANEAYRNILRSEAELRRGDLSLKDKPCKVLCAVSGGVDSSVVATLLYRAIGERLIPVFVDTGLLRLGEREAVEKMFRENLRVPLITIDAKDEFLGLLKGVSDPEAKRKIIGETFIKVFEREAKKHNTNGEIRFLAQGTLYPDVIESVSVKGPSKTIKSHHNVGGLPEWMKFELIEPLRELFKDEVRALGRELGMPESMLMRHPFPGPGLAIRIMGEVNEADLELLKRADSIFIEELRDKGYYDSVWQAFCVLLNVKSVGVMGDNRTYDNTICVRAVEALDGMTATFAHLPHDFLEGVANRIINEVEGINRVVYDITSKPPGTIEWE